MNKPLHNSNLHNRNFKLLLGKLTSPLTLLFLGVILSAASTCTFAQESTKTTRLTEQDQDRNSFVEKYSIPEKLPTQKNITSADPQSTDNTVLPELQIGQNASSASTPTSAAPKSKYKPLHEQSIWEKLKVPPKPPTAPTPTAGQDQGISSSQMQPQRHNIYK